MIEKVKVYENNDLFQQICNCCSISATPIKNYKLDIILSNGQNQVLRLCDEHLNELYKAIKNLKTNEDAEISVKVKVSREVAEAIEYLQRNIDYGFSEFMRVKTQGGWKTFKASPLNKIKIETLANAILHGYEVEKSPEEKVLEHYEGLGESISAMERKLGIKGTLELLGIKIKGVNS